MPSEPPIERNSVEPEVAKDLARVCALNALAAVADVIGSLDRVTRIVKVTGFVASAPGFNGQPGVVNGASEVLGDIFGEAGRHARSAVGVAELPLDAPVEVAATCPALSAWTAATSAAAASPTTSRRWSVRRRRVCVIPET